MFWYWSLQQWYNSSEQLHFQQTKRIPIPLAHLPSPSVQTARGIFSAQQKCIWRSTMSASAESLGGIVSNSMRVQLREFALCAFFWAYACTLIFNWFVCVCIARLHLAMPAPSRHVYESLQYHYYLLSSFLLLYSLRTPSLRFANSRTTCKSCYTLCVLTSSTSSLTHTYTDTIHMVS